MAILAKKRPEGQRTDSQKAEGQKAEKPEPRPLTRGEAAGVLARMGQAAQEMIEFYTAHAGGECFDEARRAERIAHYVREKEACAMGERALAR